MLCFKKRKKVSAASLRRRKLGLGSLIHINMSCILIHILFIATHITSNTLLVSNGSIVLPLLLIPSYKAIYIYIYMCIPPRKVQQLAGSDKRLNVFSVVALPDLDEDAVALAMAAAVAIQQQGPKKGQQQGQFPKSYTN